MPERGKEAKWESWKSGRDVEARAGQLGRGQPGKYVEEEFGAEITGGA